MSNELAVRGNSVSSLLMSPDRMTNLIAFAGHMANGTVMVPKHLQGRPADCLAIAMQATEWGMNPFTVAQKTHVVSGTLGYEAQLIIAVLQTTGAIVGRFKYEYEGAGVSLKCRVGAIPGGESEIVWNEWLSISEVTTKNSPLWKSNPKQQMGYLQAKFWARLYAPGAILGVYSPDELEERFLPEDEPRTATATVQAESKPALPQAPPELDAETFAAKLSVWAETVKRGTQKTAPGAPMVAQLLAGMASKYTFTAEQIEQIKALHIEPAAEESNEVIEGEFL